MEDAPLLAGGISQALVSTAAGLSVAIPALLFHRFFNAKIEGLVVLIDMNVENYRLFTLSDMKLIPKNRKSEAELNLTPLIDIVFLLLIFFMVSTRFDTNKRHDIDVPLSSYSESKTETSVSIFVDINNIVTIKQKVFHLDKRDDIKKELDDLKNLGLNHVTVVADSRINYQSFIDIMESLAFAGINRVSFSVERSD